MPLSYLHIRMNKYRVTGVTICVFWIFKDVDRSTRSMLYVYLNGM